MHRSKAKETEISALSYEPYGPKKGLSFAFRLRP